MFIYYIKTQLRPTQVWVNHESATLVPEFRTNTIITKSDSYSADIDKQATTTEACSRLLSQPALSEF
jgi:hypothetical protein